MTWKWNPWAPGLGKFVFGIRILPVAPCRAIGHEDPLAASTHAIQAPDVLISLSPFLSPVLSSGGGFSVLVLFFPILLLPSSPFFF